MLLRLCVVHTDLEGTWIHWTATMIVSDLGIKCRKDGRIDSPLTNADCNVEASMLSSFTLSLSLLLSS
jgi:hypothetical protein